MPPTLRRLAARLADGLAMARAAGRPVRLLNTVTLVASYRLSVLIKRPLVWAMPAAVSLEPTTSCNLRCPECPSGLRSFERPTGMLGLEVAQTFLAQAARRAFYLNLYFQGEPYLHPQFLELVRLARGLGMYTATSTNGHYLTPARAAQTVTSGLSRLIISIDGTTQGTYQAYRVGGSLQKVLDGTRNLLAARRQAGAAHPYIIWQYLVVGPNEHQVDDARRMAAELGVDEIRFKTAQIYDYENGSELIPQNPRYSRYQKRKDGRYKMRHTLSDRCWKSWSGCVATWDGRIVPCCFDKDAHHQMGQISTQSLPTIWRSDAYMRFRAQLLTARSEIEICRNCTEGAKVFD